MTPRGLAANLALLAVGVLAAGAMAETALRVYARGRVGLAREIRVRDPYAVLVEPHGEFGYRQRPSSTFRYPTGASATSNRLSYRGPEVSVPKPPGAVRIVLLGESSTHGWGVPDHTTIDGYMRRSLAARDSGHRWEVVNLAFDGYDAYQIFERLRSDGLRFGPDLIIVNAGVNDVRNARFPRLVDRDPRTLIWEDEIRRLREERRRGGPALKTRIKHTFFLARLPGILAETRRRAGSVAIRRDVRPQPEAADNFERNVERIVVLAHRAGIPVVLSTPPTDTTVASTAVRTYWIGDAATTQAYRDILAGRLRRVADRQRAAGWRIAYVAPVLARENFLDDVHLTPAGNARIATAFVDAALALLRTAAAPGAPGARPPRSTRP